MTRQLGALTGAVAALGLSVTTSFAQDLDTIRFMKVVPNPYAFIIADVGVEHGIFERHGIDLDISASSGDARLQQAMAAGEADIGLSSGTSLGFVARGTPVIAFMATHGAPLNMGILVTPNSDLAEPGKSAEDLRGRNIGVSSPAALSYFFARRLAVEMGWEPDEVNAVSLGALPALMAAAEAGNIDGFVMSVDTGFNLEEQGAAQVFLSFGDYIDEFHTHALLVTNDFREQNPDAVRRFAAAWLETVEFVLDNKQAMVDAGIEVLGMSEEVASRSYDLITPAFSRTGRFEPEALAVIAEGLVETGIMEELVDLSDFYTHEYLPSEN